VALLIKKTKSERAIEYPWVLKQVAVLHRGARVLDVGCCESLLSQKLIAMGFSCYGIDIREYPFKNDRMIFIKRNVLDTGLPNEFFDGIIAVSTIEHITLNPQGESILEDEGDIMAMKELCRILKPGGIITIPYVTRSNISQAASYRIYNRETYEAY